MLLQCRYFIDARALKISSSASDFRELSTPCIKIVLELKLGRLVSAILTDLTLFSSPCDGVAPRLFVFLFFHLFVC